MTPVLITTVPFGAIDPTPRRLLTEAGIEYTINPIERKLTEDELADLIKDYEVVIAGTEPITRKVLDHAKRLRLISRVGIGLDSVDLHAAREKNIAVSYTPDAPAPAVAELTLGLMLSLLRSIHVSNAQIHGGQWKRIFGRRLGELTVGVIGVGRIGTRIIRSLHGFDTARILAHDIAPNEDAVNAYAPEWVSKEQIYAEADIISLHVPLTGETRNLITRNELVMMKPDALLLNTARGGIVNEDDLYHAMKNNHLAGAAVDVFTDEPYNGPLREIERCILTAHMGSMSVDCRARMEIESTEEAVRLLQGQPLQNRVPEDEYRNQS